MFAMTCVVDPLAAVVAPFQVSQPDMRICIAWVPGVTWGSTSGVVPTCCLSRNTIAPDGNDRIFRLAALPWKSKKTAAAATAAISTNTIQILLLRGRRGAGAGTLVSTGVCAVRDS